MNILLAYGNKFRNLVIVLFPYRERKQREREREKDREKDREREREIHTHRDSQTQREKQREKKKLVFNFNAALSHTLKKSMQTTGTCFIPCIKQVPVMQTNELTCALSNCCIKPCIAYTFSEILYIYI